MWDCSGLEKQDIRRTNGRPSPIRLLRLNKLPKRPLSQRLRSTIHERNTRIRLRLLVRNGVPILVGEDLANGGNGVVVEDAGERGGEDYAFDSGLELRGSDEVQGTGDGGLEEVFLVILYGATQTFRVSI